MGVGLWGGLNGLPSLPPALLPQVLGLESMLGTATLWPLLLGITVLPALLQLVLLPFCPESPRYLYIIRNLEGPARKSELPGRPAVAPVFLPGPLPVPSGLTLLASRSEAPDRLGRRVWSAG